MSRRHLLMVAAAVIAIGAVVALVMLRGGGEPADAEPHPTALVTVALVMLIPLSTPGFVQPVTVPGPSVVVQLAANA